MKNWKTTILAIIGALPILAMQAVALLDDDPNTNLDPTQITLALGMLGVGAQARDKDVTSEGNRIE